MKSMTWTPDEEHDKQINAYLDQINHAPYELIALILFSIFCIFTLVVLIGVF
jgi:hypothetical protein